MTLGSPSRFLRQSSLSHRAVILSMLAMLGTACYLGWRYASLPDILPVHFKRGGQPNGWQFRTISLVFMPLFVQLGIFSTCAAIGTLLLSRKDASTAASLPDARAAVSAVEAVMLMAAIWVAFQAYAAHALVRVWDGGAASLGAGYTAGEAAGLIITVIVAVRAQRQLGRPGPLPFVPTDWRLGQLYCNTDHPALFVPTRDGRRWTLNFGRPAAVVLLGGILAVGVVAPTLMLTLVFR